MAFSSTAGPTSPYGSLCLRGDAAMDEPEVFVALDRTLVPIEREVFVGLFTNSVVSGYAGVRHALEGRPMPMSELLKLSRQAEIPYPLFFAPREVVEAQIRL